MQIILKDETYDFQDFFFIGLLIFVFSAIGGFIYETIFYRIAFGYFIKRGTTFGPWIPIYGTGGLLMTLGIWRWQKNPFAIFFLSFLITGIFEFLVGFVLFHVFSIRLWDYYSEPWNFGNIGGFVCLRSAGIFGLFGFLLFYVLIPAILSLRNHFSIFTFKIFSCLLSGIFFLDIIIHMISRGLTHGNL